MCLPRCLRAHSAHEALEAAPPIHECQFDRVRGGSPCARVHVPHV